MILHISSWQQVEAYLKNSQTIIIPVGSTEQHGPTGLLGTDAICPEAIALECEKLCDVLVAPTFNVGNAHHHLGFPGTISLKPSTMILAVKDWVASLVKHGFKNIIWFNGHGGNIAPLGTAFVDIYADYSFAQRTGDNAVDFTLLQKNWWDLPTVAKLLKELIPENDGMHATVSEISLTMAVFKGERFPDGELIPEIAPTGRFRDAADYRNVFPDGRIGSKASLANKDIGFSLLDAGAKDLSEFVKSLD